MPNIAVIDFEAQSSSTSTGKIISVSGILYNDQFQELDRFELFCRNVPGYIPDPYFVTDFQLAYKVNKDFTTNLGIYNIFDTTYYKWSDLRSNGGDGSDDKYYQRYAQPGTSIVAGFSWRF